MNKASKAHPWRGTFVTSDQYRKAKYHGAKALTRHGNASLLALEIEEERKQAATGDRYKK